MSQLPCNKCKTLLDETELWVDNHKGCKRHNFTYSQTIKYTCPKCNYDQWWIKDPRFTDTTKKTCEKCKEETKEKYDQLNKIKLNPSLMKDITYSDDCLESYPCLHTLTITLENNKRHSYQMDGVEIYKLYTEMNLNSPSHFTIYKNYENESGLFDDDDDW